MIAFIIAQNKVDVFINGKMSSMNKDNIWYPSLLKALEKNDEEGVKKSLLAEIPSELKNEEFNGVTLPAVLVSILKDMESKRLPMGGIVEFCKNYSENERFELIVDENLEKDETIGLFDFLKHGGLPITPDGCFLAYKGVKVNYWSSQGNLKTRVLKGRVDESGRIYNGIGEIIEVEREDVDTNRSESCSTGLHVGTLDYVEGSYLKILIVKVNPKDVVSVPFDYEGKKMRVCKYEVVGDYENLLQQEDVAEEPKKKDPQSREFKKARIENYLNKKSGPVSIRSIQNIFSPESPSKLEITDLLNEMGEDHDETYVYLA